MWNQRYSAEEYVYGTEANTFLAQHASQLSGPVLSLGEGEGRNAVFLASRGLEVLGVDASSVGLTKARKLAEARGVRIRTEVVDLRDYEPPPESFGAVISIFAHLPGDLRTRVHAQIVRTLRPGGILLLEAYSKAQIARDTGGPKDVDMLLSADILKADFPQFEIILLREIERDVNEGNFHTGLASVVQFIARKPDGAHV
jgi:SAM-dependent methyltransferase